MHAFFHAGDLTELVLAQALEKLLCDAQRERHLACQLKQGHFTCQVQGFERKVLQKVSSNTRFLDGPGGRDLCGRHNGSLLRYMNVAVKKSSLRALRQAQDKLRDAIYVIESMQRS